MKRNKCVFRNIFFSSEYNGRLWEVVIFLLLTCKFRRSVLMDRYGSYHRICDWEWVFCTKFNSEQFLFKVIFDIISIFCSVQPQSELPFQFQYIIIFQKWQYFKNGNLYSTLAPFLGETTKVFFVGNLIPNNFCLKWFWIQSVFFAAFSLKVIQLSHSSKAASTLEQKRARGRLRRGMRSIGDV